MYHEVEKLLMTFYEELIHLEVLKKLKEQNNRNERFFWPSKFLLLIFKTGNLTITLNFSKKNFQNEKCNVTCLFLSI